jgi:hypothetical protein
VKNKWLLLCYKFQSMAPAKKRTREELIAGGYCPVCSKCTASLGGGLRHCGALYGCRRCGTLLLELNYAYDDPTFSILPHFVDVTEHWPEIRDWYDKRREEIEAHTSELEMRLLAEVPGVITAMLARTRADSTGAARSSRRLTLVKS